MDNTTINNDIQIFHTQRYRVKVRTWEFDIEGGEMLDRFVTRARHALKARHEEFQITLLAEKVGEE